MSPRARARSTAKNATAKPATAKAAEGTKVPGTKVPRPRTRRSRLTTDGTLPPLEEILPKAPVEPIPEPALSTELAGGAPEPEPESEGEAAAMPVGVRLATAAELDDWDSHAVTSPEGHIYQSRGWAEHRAAHGWRPWYLVYEDGFRLLVFGKPDASGGAAYASRGPIPERRVELSARRAAAAAELLAENGAEALIVDGEMPAAAGLADYLEVAGFQPTDEIQPSRHRMEIKLGPDDAPNSDEKTIFSSFGATARNAIRQSERHALKVRRLDAGGGRADPNDPSGLLEEFEAVDVRDDETTEVMLSTFYRMLGPGVRVDTLALGSETMFLDWMRRAVPAGHAIYLQAEHAEDGPVAGAVFYRQGHRLTYALAGERSDMRRTYPGATRLLVWRGIQVALDERRTRVDLGGVDVAGARHKPKKGAPTYGAYQLRESFGARWVDLTGAHRRTMRPVHQGVRRVAGALRRIRRLAS